MRSARLPSRGGRLAVALSALGLLVGSSFLLLRSSGSAPLRATDEPGTPSPDALPRTREPRIERPEGDDQAGERETEFLASSAPRPSDPLHDEDVEPHPVTEQRLRMAKHHAWFEALSDLLKRKNYRLARRMIREHEREFHSEDGLEADRRGFELLVDCLEAPSERARETAEAFLEQERLTPLRRTVRRVCLEGRDFR